MLGTVGAFLLALGILVVFHELGHYAVARFFGVRVIRFSLGFGKPLIRKQFSTNGTEWVVCPIPLGGYVRMVDERDPDSLNVPDYTPDQAFTRKPVWQRALIVLAGPVMNLFLAVIFYAAVQVMGTTEPTARLASPPTQSVLYTAGLLRDDVIQKINDQDIRGWSDLNWAVLKSLVLKRDLHLEVERGGVHMQVLMAYDADTWPSASSPRSVFDLGFSPLESSVSVGRVLPGSAAEKAGLMTGDQLLSVQGQTVEGSGAFTQIVRSMPGKTVQIEVLRQGQKRLLEAVPEAVKDPVSGAENGRLGIGLSGRMDIQSVSMGLPEALLYGVRHTVDVSVFSLVAFGKMLTGQLSWKMLSGPVSIADAAGQSARVGLDAYIAFLAMVSVSLGVLNLLPVPLLDGGHLLYYFAEWVRGRPVSDVWFEWGQKLGLLLIGLMTVLALFNDIQRFF